jgi:nucleotide-binding universal stress UspA family protein
MPSFQKTAFSATKILLPIDFSSMSEAALEAATGIAQQFHASIHLEHIVPEIPDFNGADFFPESAVLEERKETIEERLADRQDKLTLKGISTTVGVERGNDIVGTLMRVIKQEHIDMVVISTHGLSGWRPFVAGSIASELIKQVDCTLLLLQPSHLNSANREPTIRVPEESFLPLVETVSAIRSRIYITETPADKRLDQSAENLAEQSTRTENKYDEAHSLFTK